MTRKWLLEIRTQKALTHDEVAQAAGIQRAYYTMIENGTRQPSVGVAKKIAETLKFDWTFFFDHKGNEMTRNTNSA